MRRYDFSKIPENGRENLHGFGNVIRGLRNAAYNVFHLSLDAERTERNQDVILAAYGYMVSQYATIDFEELDHQDEDFHTLFETRRLLPELGQAISMFLKEPTKAHYHTVEQVCTSIFDADHPPYRDRIKQIEERFSQEIDV